MTAAFVDSSLIETSVTGVLASGGAIANGGCIWAGSGAIGGCGVGARVTCSCGAYAGAIADGDCDSGDHGRWGCSFRRIVNGSAETGGCPGTLLANGGPADTVSLLTLASSTTAHERALP